MIAFLLIIIFLLLVALGFAGFFLVRAAKRLFEYDELMSVIVAPMEEYADELRKIASAEGLLHDHPEVLAFHRANMVMLGKLDEAISSIKESRPQEPKVKGLPPVVV